MSILTMQNQTEEKARLNFLIPKSLDTQSRLYVSNKYDGYYRGSYTKELELALKKLMDSEVKE